MSQQQENPVREAISSAIANNEVILFMKGTPEAPACGFSARTVGALQSLGVPFADDQRGRAYRAAAQAAPVRTLPRTGACPLSPVSIGSPHTTAPTRIALLAPSPASAPADAEKPPPPAPAPPCRLLLAARR